jgi:hypothetical protein
LTIFHKTSPPVRAIIYSIAIDWGRARL